MTSKTDTDLLREFADRKSEEAFTELVSRHVNLVYSVALRQLGDCDQAEEVAQAVFIILSRKAGSLHQERALGSWLFQTTRLTARNFLRSELRRRRREQEAYMQSHVHASEADASPQFAPLLDAAIERLGDNDRRAIVLRYFEGRNLQDVGVALGTSQAAAEKRVHRAVNKLRTFVSRHGSTLSASAVAATIATHSVQAAPAGLATKISVAASTAITTTSAVGTLVNGVLKTMTWMKIKLAGGLLAATALIVGSVTVAVSQTNSDQPVTAEVILGKTKAAYAALTSYRDEGRTIANVGGISMTNHFTIKLARPNLYRISWAQRVFSGHTNQGVVWSSGSANFMVMGDGPESAKSDMVHALSSATGVSGGAAATVPGSFFQLKWGNIFLGSAVNCQRLVDDQVNSDECYVVHRPLNSREVTLWIGKKDYLLRQIRTTTSAAAMKKALDEAAAINGGGPGGGAPAQSVVSTEIHEHVVANPKLVSDEFAR